MRIYSMTTQRYNLALRNSLPKHQKWCYIFYYIVRKPKPMKHRFQRYIVRMEIFSTFHARVEYILVKTVILRKMDLPTPCSDDVTVYL